MGLLSFVLWWLTVSKEIFSMVSLSDALRSVPTAEQTEISSTADRPALVSMARWRKATVVGVLVVRSFVCLALAVCGTLHLASTISLGDLLLNAVALEVLCSRWTSSASTSWPPAPFGSSSPRRRRWRSLPAPHGVASTGGPSWRALPSLSGSHSCTGSLCGSSREFSWTREKRSVAATWTSSPASTRTAR
ncbi:unnamed protein product [Prorocentrum cordatum]|uniref:Uncharacterized protein n=1 Tax=Prorocentrum cordatum TaxID=2364126 RepID=A0ABN9TWU8_9DINO|nr:unnamed protein product [Polarella glacialis]